MRSEISKNLEFPKSAKLGEIPQIIGGRKVRHRKSYGS
jgi:hypothetical protein